MNKILIIEDEKEIRSNIIEILILEGFEAMSAENGLIGIELAKKYLPDVILCDITMPELDGYGVLTELRSDPQTQTIPFVFLTAMAMKSDFRKGMGLGADDYLTKPLKIDDLLNTINNQLGKKAATEKQVEDMKLQIATMLPHEMNTPLASIIGFAEMLSLPNFSQNPKELQTIAEGIEKNAKRLQRLVENYLLFTDLALKNYNSQEKNKWNENGVFYTRESIQQVAIKKAIAVDREGDLQLDLINDLIEIPLNSFKKIIEELLDNAFKFSEKGSHVIITTKVVGPKFCLSVKDNGRGMAEDQIQRIQAFNQFERNLYEQQGSGMGLFLAKKLVELNNGNLKIESEVNKGTTATVIFPNENYNIQFNSIIPHQQ